MTWTYQANEAGKAITAVSNGGFNTIRLSVTAHGYDAGDAVKNNEYK